METLLSHMMSSLHAAGGGIAVGFIITIAAGILAMTFVYVGSALLVLDRFARVASGWVIAVLAGIVVAASMALFSTLSNFPSDSVFTWDEWRSTFFRQLATFLVAGVFFESIALIGTRFLSQGRMAMIITAVAVVAAGLALAGTGNVTLAPSAFAAATFLALVCFGLRPWTSAHSRRSPASRMVSNCRLVTK